jgi:hypothetical protein
LDPYDENYNKRVDVSVILVAFDFDGFAKVKGLEAGKVEDAFRASLAKALPTYVKRLDAQLKKHGVANHTVEVFFLPTPSVDEMRTLFQTRIGWTAG